MKPPWLIKAESYIGVEESSDLPEIMGWIKDADGDTKREPWCADFVTEMLKPIKGSGSPAAASYVKWGVDVSKTKPIGAIVVFKWSTGEHHVSFYYGNGKFLGGNQTEEHEVITESLPMNRAVAWRWPEA